MEKAARSTDTDRPAAAHGVALVSSLAPPAEQGSGCYGAATLPYLPQRPLLSSEGQPIGHLCPAPPGLPHSLSSLSLPGLSVVLSSKLSSHQVARGDITEPVCPCCLPFLPVLLLLLLLLPLLFPPLVDNRRLQKANRRVGRQRRRRQISPTPWPVLQCQDVRRERYI